MPSSWDKSAPGDFEAPDIYKYGGFTNVFAEEKFCNNISIQKKYICLYSKIKFNVHFVHNPTVPKRNLNHQKVREEALIKITKKLSTELSNFIIHIVTSNHYISKFLILTKYFLQFFKLVKSVRGQKRLSQIQASE